MKYLRDVNGMTGESGLGTDGPRSARPRSSCRRSPTSSTALRRDIARGVYKPGPIRVRALAERFGVSATPVREALRRLEAEGLVTSATARSWSIRSPATRCTRFTDPRRAGGVRDAAGGSAGSRDDEEVLARLERSSTRWTRTSKARGVAGGQRGVPPAASTDAAGDAAARGDHQSALGRGRAVPPAVRLDRQELPHRPGAAPADRPRSCARGVRPRRQSACASTCGRTEETCSQKASAKPERPVLRYTAELTEVKRFPSPFEVEPPAGAEDWQRLYPYYYLFSEERREFEEGKFWFFDGMHNPEPIYPFDTIMTESWWVALNMFDDARVRDPARARASTSGSSTATSTSARTRSPTRT